MKAFPIFLAGITGICFGIGFLAWWIPRTTAPEEESAAQVIYLTSEAERQQFLATQGIPVCRCIAIERVTLPAVVDETYQPYAEMQAVQGLPLTDSLGTEAVRYTYIPDGPNTATVPCTELLLDESSQLIGAMQYQADQAQTTMTPLWTDTP